MSATERTAGNDWDVGFAHGIEWIYDLNCVGADIPERSALSRDEFIALLTAVGDGSALEDNAYPSNAFRVLMAWFDRQAAAAVAAEMQAMIDEFADYSDKQKINVALGQLRQWIARLTGTDR